jgi:two-component system chemotaxis sensor kinase CheA
MSFTFRSLLTNVLRSGIKTPLEAEEQIRLLFINSIIIVGDLALAIFALRDGLDRNYVFSAVTGAIFLIVVFLFILIRATKNFRLGLWFLPVLMALFYGYLVAVGGRGSSGSLWSLSYPLIAIFLLSYKRGAFFTGLYFVGLLVLLYFPGLSPAFSLDSDFKIRLLGTYAVIFIFVMEFEFIRVQAQLEMERSRQALDKTTIELLAEKAQTDGILRNVQEGICLLDSSLKIKGRYSASLEELLDHPELEGMSLADYFTEVLPQREAQAVKDYLTMFFQARVNKALLREINPLSEVRLTTPRGRTKTLNFLFSPVELEDKTFVLVTLRDETTTSELNQRLREEEDRAARQMRHLFQIIHVQPELLLQFLEDAADEIADINRRLKINDHADLAEVFYQGVHAVKGNAALIGLSSFSERLHELEAQVQDLRIKDLEWNNVLVLTVELSKIQAELEEIRGLLEKMETFGTEMARSVEQKDLIVLTLERAVTKLSQESAKEVRLDLTDFNPVHVSQGHRKLIKDVLVQLVRNSFAHGLETPEERGAQQKPRWGTIRVACSCSQDELSLTYSDDGRGLDLQKLRKAALRLPGWSPQKVQALGEEQAVALIFQTGFSTVEAANLHAGRGVGLGLVKNRIETSGGRLVLSRTIPYGLSFDIKLPRV